MKIFLPAIVCSIVLAFCSALLPARLSAQVDTVQVLEQPGSREFECCYTFIVTNRHPSDVTISEFRIRMISGNEHGMFLPGQGGAPIDWSIFLSTREVQWISQTFAAEIDSGESLTSFRVCVRDTGVFRMAWETRGLEGVLSRDTIVFVCSQRDNCDQAFFRPLPSGKRCGFDIDLLNENGDQKVINDFHLAILTPGFTFDTAGMRIPSGWRLDRVSGTGISWKTTNSELSFAEFIENFRIYVNTGGSPFVEMAWWTTSFGDQVCRDSLFLLCGLNEPDTLYTRTASVGSDTCCRDFLLINTHVPRSPLKNFRLVGGPSTHLMPPTDLPDGWSYTLNSANDTLLLTIDSLLAPGDTVIFPGICFENDLAPGDSAFFLWRTEYDDLQVTEGIGLVPCFRRVIFCDSVSAVVDSSLVAEDRCITLKVADRNSRRDPITRVSVRISNPGTPHRILRAKAPAGWTIDQITSDSVIFHRGFIEPGQDQDGFEFCVNIDTNALDPLLITWTTWVNTQRAICTGQIQVKADGARECDNAVFVENGESIDPLCCFDVTFYNRNERGYPITSMQLRMPSIDLIFDGASVGNAGGKWRVGTEFFPSVDVNYVGDTLKFGDSVTFRFCVNAAALPQRPVNFQVVWQTYSGSQPVCFDTVVVGCEGTAGECDTITSTRNGSDQGCLAYYRVRNSHTPAGPINNVQFSIVAGGANFVSGEALGTAAGFSQVSLAPKTIIFRGSTIAPGEAVEEFHLNFDATQDMDIVLEICTFEDDQQICCTLDTVECTFLGVEDEEVTAGELSHSVIPNPFGDRTEFRYAMARPGGVTLVLLNAEGKEVRRYADGMHEAGTHTLILKADDLPSGVYYYVLQAGTERGTGRVILVK